MKRTHTSLYYRLVLKSTRVRNVASSGIIVWLVAVKRVMRIHLEARFKALRLDLMHRVSASFELFLEQGSSGWVGS